MSATNFNTTKVMDKFGLPLMVMSDEMLYKYVMEEEPTEDVNPDDFAWEVRNGLYCVMEDIAEEFDELKDKLRILSIELIDGYYTGVQFIVKTNDINPDYLPINESDNWDEWELWHYFDAETIEEANNNLHEEIRLINEFFEWVKSYGFRPLNLVGVFSNGEGIYEWAEQNTKGTFVPFLFYIYNNL